MKKSALLIEHEPPHPYTRLYSGHYMYPQLDTSRRNQLYNALLYLVGISTDTNMYVAQYTIVTCEGSQLSAPTRDAIERLTGRQPTPILTTEIIGVLRSELDNIVMTVLLRSQNYRSPLKRP